MNRIRNVSVGRWMGMLEKGEEEVEEGEKEKDPLLR